MSSDRDPIYGDKDRRKGDGDRDNGQGHRVPIQSSVECRINNVIESA